MSSLYEKQKEYDELHELISTVYKEAGEDLDINRVSVLSGSEEERLEQLAAHQNRFEALGKEIAALKGVKEKAVKIIATDRSADLSLGERVVRDESYVRAKGSRGGFTTELTDVDMKAVFTTAAGWMPESLRTGRVAEGIYAPAPGILDVIPFGETTQNMVVYMQESAGTNAAAATAENGQYPEQTLLFTEVSMPVRKIAVRLPVTDEVLDDDARVASIIDNRLRWLLRQRLGDQVLNGNGTAPNLAGILSVSGIGTQAGATAANLIDKLTAAIVDVYEAEATPSAVVVSAVAYEYLLNAKDSSGAYILGNPAAGSAGTFRGIQLAVSNQLPANTLALVGDFSTHSELVFRRGLTVEVGHDGNDFGHGRKTIRGDVRVALCIYRPAAFSAVTT